MDKTPDIEVTINGIKCKLSTHLVEYFVVRDGKLLSYIGPRTEENHEPL